MDQIAHKVLRFDRFVLDLTRGCLRTGDEDIDLPPKAFEVLCHLAQNAGRLVPKQEFYEAVWPNVLVSSDSLVQCIRELRQKLGDDEHSLIKTVSRRGYLLDVPISTGDRPAERQSPIMKGNAATSLVPPRDAGDLPLPDRPSIAVLAFANLSGDPLQDYLSDGVAEDIITGLSKIHDLFVIARNSAFTYRGKPFNAKQIGRELGVRYLLEGSIRRDGEQLRITSRLVDAGLGRQIWSEHYDRDHADIFAVQDEVTQKIVVTLVARITKSELDRTLRKRPEALAAYDYYLRGNALIEEAYRLDRTINIQAARRLYEQSLIEDPRYAPAITGLARTYQMAWVEPTNYEPIAREYQQQEILDRALSLAQQAVALDGDLPEAHAILGLVLHWQYRRLESMAEWRRALELNPNLVEGRYAISLYHSGRAAEAIDYTKRIMRLDPSHSPRYFSYLGNGYYLAGRYSEALEALRTCKRRSKNPSLKRPIRSVAPE